MINKRRAYFGFLLVIFLSLTIGFYVLGCKSKNTKSETLSRLISDLEEYKSKYKKYPNDLKTGNIRSENWIYYTTDSSQDNFSLSYSDGVMDSNTLFYNSQTKSGKRNLTINKLKVERLSLSVTQRD